MASITLTKEDGSGKANANAYANEADGDAYHDGHLYATAWTGADSARKVAALLMATRLIDAEYAFGGGRCVAAQALQWPRVNCREPDGSTAQFILVTPAITPSFAGSVGASHFQGWTGTWLVVPSNVVPRAVVEATIELARELLIADRTASPEGEGLKYHNQTGTQTGYDKTDRRPIISAVAQAMLSKYGSLVNAKSGAVRLVRS